MKLNSLIIEALKTRYEEILSNIFVYENGELTLNDKYHIMDFDKNSLRICFNVNEEFDISQLYTIAYHHYMRYNPNSSKVEFERLFNSYDGIKKFNLWM